MDYQAIFDITEYYGALMPKDIGLGVDPQSERAIEALAGDIQSEKAMGALLLSFEFFLNEFISKSKFDRKSATPADYAEGFFWTAWRTFAEELTKHTGLSYDVICERCGVSRDDMPDGVELISRIPRIDYSQPGEMVKLLFLTLTEKNTNVDSDAKAEQARAG